jgi:uncharacterized peroxidase-related enzyme
VARLSIPTRDDAPSEAKAALGQVAQRFGRVPNFYRLLSISPKVLDAHTKLVESLAGLLDLRTRERIAVAVAQACGSDYGLAEHSYTAQNFGNLSPVEFARARRGEAADPKAAVAVAFAYRVAQTGGKVTEDDLATIRVAEFSDAEVVDIVAVVAANFFAALINNVGQTELDFPRVDPVSPPDLPG